MDSSWDVFIAYSSTDRSLAEKLTDALEPDVTVFLDSRCIRPGDDWDTTLRDALLSASICVVLVSPSTDQAFFQRDEILRAIDRSRQSPPQTRVVPIFIGGIQPDSAELPYGLKPKQGISISGDKDIFDVAEQILDLYTEREIENPNLSRFCQSIRLHMSKLKQNVEELTQEQFRVIKMLRYTNRVRISGTAGSGKTLVAAEKASRLSDANLRVLFLCHNPLLAELVKQLTAGKGVCVMDFGAWIKALTHSKPSTLKDWSYFNEPSNASIDKALEILSLKENKYDAVIVDEGQDFRESWWLAVEAALQPENGLFYIFHDNNQSLLPHRSTYPIIDPHIDLSRNCRNAGRVFELMRCFNSDCPNSETRLKDKGKVLLRTVSSGQEKNKVVEVLSELYVADLIANTVILWMGGDSIPASPLVGIQCRLSDCGSWQVEVKKQFGLIFNSNNQNGVSVPPRTESKVADLLSKLSSCPFPTSSDINLVINAANLFNISHEVRSRIESHRLYSLGFRWHKVGSQLKLKRRASPGAIWAAELILHFSCDAWHNGIPKGEVFYVQPFYEPRTTNTIPVYGIPDFKGLEADSVILVLRGKVLNPIESIYVGISRARLLLNIVAEQSSVNLLPRSFVWDGPINDGSTC